MRYLITNKIKIVRARYILTELLMALNKSTSRNTGMQQRNNVNLCWIKGLNSASELIAKMERAPVIEPLRRCFTPYTPCEFKRKRM